MKGYILIFTLLLIFLTSSESYGQLIYPGGETCETSIPILPGSYSLEFIDGTGLNWYFFVAPCDGTLSIMDGDISVYKSLYSGSCDDLVLIDFGVFGYTITNDLSAGDSVYILIDISYEFMGDFLIGYTDCDEIDSALLDVSGRIYYDENNNGIRDPGELDKPFNLLITDPSGLICVTGMDGFYFSSIAGLADGAYDISPVLPMYWGVSSDSSKYTIIVDDFFEQMDSLDFGLHLDTLIHVVTASGHNSYPICNDTLFLLLNYQNIGTTTSSGIIHLELDDSLYLVSTEELPDSIVGQNIYWHYEDLLVDEVRYMLVRALTPDGVDDYLSSTFTVNADSAGIEFSSSSAVISQHILCPYDPNDKTPSPVGIGEFGYISPETAYIDYLVRFQNTGTDTAYNVVIKDELDENLDWYSLFILSYSHDMRLEMNLDGEVSFIFDDIMLPDSGANMLASQGYVQYRVNLLPDLPLGTTIFNTANIYFDLNPAVVTNTTINTLHIDDNGVHEWHENQYLLVYPNPFSESVTVYFGEELDNYSIQIVDLLGNEVYSNNGVNGNQLEIHPGPLAKGMYLMILTSNAKNETVSTTKIVVK